MKKLIVFFFLVTVTLISYAGDKLDYVIIGDQTYFSEDVRVGTAAVKISTDNGMTLKAPLKDVNAYFVDGKYCQRLPIICKNGETKCTALLELVSMRNGLQLFKYRPGHENENLGCCFFDSENEESMYFIYKNEKLYLRVDKENAETVFNFFRIDFKENS
jgi:hypothetical protein